MSAVHAAESSDTRSTLELFALLLELQLAVYAEAKLEQPRLTAAAAVRRVGGAAARHEQTTLADRAMAAGARLTLLINTQHRINDVVRAMFAAAPTTVGKPG